MKELYYLNKYLLKYKFQLLLGTVFIVVGNVFIIVPAVAVREAFDILEENYKIFKALEGFEMKSQTYALFTKSIVIPGTIIVISAIMRGIFMFFMRQTIIVMSRHVEFDLKNEIYKHYQSLPLSFYRKNNTGDLMNRISEDVSRVRMYVGPAIMYGINMFTLFCMVIPFMVSINPRLTLYSLLPLPILSFSIYFVNNIINKRSEEIQKSLSDLSTFVQEAFSGIRVIKAFVREDDYHDKFTHESNVYKDKSLRLTFVNALFFPLIMGLIGLSVILTVYIGSQEVIAGQVSVGNIAEFIIYVNMLTWPVTSLGWITSIVQRASASQRRVNEFLLTKTNINSGELSLPSLKGTIVFDNVSFTYPHTGIEALKNVNFKIKEGGSLAIIGTTGSGKSTIANLICRMYDVTEGKVSIDGHTITSLDLQTLRSSIGYVPQDVFLFSDTIKNNIAFGSDKLTDEQIEQAASDSDLLANIKSFKEGFDTRVGERGITLSGGQKQRVSIARAIAKEPSILILDDSLSAVDTKTENTILNSMRRIMKGRTSIIISHRVSSAKLADHIIMLDEGRIIEEGSHDQLIKALGSYQELYEKQLQTEEVSEETLS